MSVDRLIMKYSQLIIGSNYTPHYKMIFLLLIEILISVMIIIICGLPGVGKTTVAKELAP